MTDVFNVAHSSAGHRLGEVVAFIVGQSLHEAFCGEREGPRLAAVEIMDPMLVRAGQELCFGTMSGGEDVGANDDVRLVEHR